MRKFKEYGYGFSPGTNQFEVIRMISQCAHDAHTGEVRYAGGVTEVHNLDTSVFHCYPEWCAELKLQHVQSFFFGGTETWRLSSTVQVKGVENGKITGGRSGGDAV
ncbi:hypothetical protein OIU74_001280 [Salix koriyanagi]|uniref:Uncharacterized protein n=1 Tax=Salix koriyanagi TaxID=2511006 RepID=A0A9Q0X122_9ROSI|nr:hypothetical protein OIU74_001280 [Salix koriyanagi]